MLGRRNIGASATHQFDVCGDKNNNRSRYFRLCLDGHSSRERCFSSSFDHTTNSDGVTDEVVSEETEQKEKRATIIQATSTSTSSASSSSVELPEDNNDIINKRHQRVWFPNSAIEPHYWKEDVVQGTHKNPHVLVSLFDRIEKQEVEGGRMRSKQCGVLHEDPSVDMRLLIENYTVNSLVSALRDREEMLQVASQLAAENKFEALQEFLKDCHPKVVLERRRRLRRLDLEKPLDFGSLESIRKGLMRMPRRVTTAHSKRAGVVIPLVHVDGVPSVLLEKRAAHLRAHPDEVCLPGGMVCEMSDRSIVETCLREMKEEIGGFDFEYHHETTGSQGVSVLGILRCNWGEGEDGSLCDMRGSNESHFFFVCLVISSPSFGWSRSYTSGVLLLQRSSGS
jgi:NUDIX domain